MRNQKISFSDFIAAHSGSRHGLSKDDEIIILGWLRRIGEADTEVIKCVIEKCRFDIAARDYFLARANDFAPRLLSSKGGIK